MPMDWVGSQTSSWDQILARPSHLSQGSGDLFSTRCQEQLLVSCLRGDGDQSFLNTGQGTAALESTVRSRFLGPQALKTLINILEVGV